MALLKRKQSSSGSHSRKSSLASIPSNSGSTRKTSAGSINSYQGSNSTTQTSLNTSTGIKDQSSPHLHINTNLTQENAKSSPSSPGSRLSSAPVFSGSKRLSMALRSFSSSSNSTSKGQEPSTPFSSGTTPQSSSLSRNTSFSKSASSKHDVVDSNRNIGSDSIEEEGEVTSIGASESKLIFDWDVTDPKEWTSPRVVTWLQLNGFSSKWASFFRRSQICGNEFLKLMAYDNFQKYEPVLPSNNTSSYPRFQHLLKRTMEQNVIHQHHAYTRSNGSIDSMLSKKSSKHLRTDSDNSTLSAVLQQQKQQPSQENKIQGTNKSKLAATASKQLKLQLDTKLSSTQTQYNSISSPAPESQTTQPKSNAASSLYRRSFISLRNSTSSNSTTNKQQSLNAPKLDVSMRGSESEQISGKTSPASSSHSFFKNHQKTNSSDSFFNTKFRLGNNSKNMASEPSPIKTQDQTIELVINEPKTIFETNDQTSPHTQQFPVMIVDGKYYPSRKSSVPRKHVLITKDRVTFFPVDVSGIVDSSTFKTKMSNSSNIHHKNFQIYLTDLDFDLGEEPLSDKVIETIIKHSFLEGSNKFFIKDLLKINVNRTRSASSSLMKRKMSTKSVTSSVKSSTNDEGVSTHTSSELASLEEAINGQKSYPKTPSYYYDESEATEYISCKSDKKQNLSTVGQNSQSSSFKIIRPDDSNKIDFNQKRGSPFIKLEPKREAPKPPLLSTGSSSSINGNTYHPPKLEKKGSFIIDSPKKSGKLLKRPPPPVSMYNGATSSTAQDSYRLKGNTSDSSISAFTPGSSQVLVPQPYKGTSGEAKDIEHQSIAKKSSLLALRKKTSTTSLKTTDYSTTRLTRSNSSIQSSLNSMFHSPPRSLQRKSSRRVVSSASAADVFNENDISFKDAPLLSDADRSDEECTFESVDNNVLSSGTNKSQFSFTTVTGELDFDYDQSDDSVGIVWANEKGENALESDNSDSDDGIVWSKKQNDTPTDKHHSIIDDYANSSDDELINWKTGSEQNSVIETKNTTNGNVNKQTKTSSDISRKMTLRPSPDVVYKNLEMFFPGTDLDKPVMEGNNFSTPTIKEESSPNVTANKSIQSPVMSVSTVKHSSENDDYFFDTLNNLKSSSDKGRLKTPKRQKTIRMVAHEAREARKGGKDKKLKRHNTTKLWGTKVVEITDTEHVVAINKKRNSKGEYREFAWLKGEMIGKGSFGCVYIGLNVTTGEMMAIKQVEVPKYSSNDQNVKNVVEALKMEVSTLKDLDHLNIVQYLGFEEKNNVYSLFLEYVAGGSVGSLIRLYGRFDDCTIRFLTKQVLDGLAYLHCNGILHRDMKADNLLLDLDGVCKISDFGISKKSKNIYSNADMTMRGTVFWMAPEMVDTKLGYSAKVDIWSLGCVVLEMFAGKRPWSNLEVVAAMFKIGKYKSAPPIPDDTLPLISPEGRKFLNSCFEIDPEKRPTAEHLLKSSSFQPSSDFDFSKTKLCKFINENDKMNSTKMQLEI